LTEGSIRRGGAIEWLLVLASCAAASLAAAAWSWRHGAMLNYGDAIAHMHIARRVFDARTPRLSQLGSVWLPLPHILLIPFVQVYRWWANGIAGAIPSALAYLGGCVGLYRLARRWLAPAASALALAFFALNPNLLYLQTTAMTEPLFLCETVWLVDLLVEWRTSLDENPRRTRRLLWWIVLAGVAEVFTRYDGWVMAFLAWVAIAVTLGRRGGLRSRGFWLASVVLAAAPAAWFIYNAASFGDWLDFARGPYSAKVIEMETAAHGAGPPHPGWHNPWVGELFFLKVSEMDAAAVAWGNVVLVFSVLGTAWAWLRARRRAFTWALLLWLPVPFYAYAVAYASVPIFLPPWWPHSWYNTRYGMELLPALALGLGFAAQFALLAVREFKPAWVKYAAGMLFALVVVNAWQVVREHPLVYVEGIKNRNSRRIYDAEVPRALGALLAVRPGSTILMNTSVHPEFVAFTGIPLRQTINESDLGIYRAALAAPAAHAAIVLAFDGDEIDRAVKAHPEGLTAVRRFTEKGQPSGTLYVRDSLLHQMRLQGFNKPSRRPMRHSGSIGPDGLMSAEFAQNARRFRELEVT
jgi:4-amino-4-deoxy-L-arabinose transferase-like glycosyltransferase